MEHTISVSATGEATGPPDTVTVDLGVSVVGDTVKAATIEGAGAARRISAALTRAGVAPEDIRTANYSLHPEHDHSGGTSRLTGYRLGNTVTATIRDVEAAGGVIDAATSAAGDSAVVNGIRFSIEEDAELLTAARRAAWEGATAKARELATLAGVTLAGVVSIIEGSGPIAPRPVALAAGLRMADSAPPIHAGELTIGLTLTVTFAIADRPG